MIASEHDHAPDQTLLAESTGVCYRCQQPERAFTVIRGKDYCAKCAEIVEDLHCLFSDYKPLVGTGVP